ncbi:MAG TPA: nicotinate-nucleotide diphosphorylase (carboxylating), partial [Bacteroidales bacterium]|nr:nicotinate-nucleotide diphosphorylase (carboxylating) [Bacteroidales bacterium]
NHVDFSGGIESAIDRVNIYLQEKNLNLKIVIEVRNFSELDKVLKHGGIHRIMLDNFSASDTLKAVSIINKQFEIESSGGITLDNIEDYAACRVDYISVGALTHHIKSLDLSLKACR